MQDFHNVADTQLAMGQQSHHPQPGLVAECFEHLGIFEQGGVLLLSVFLHRALQINHLLRPKRFQED
jgi:hypothetical protein